MTTTDDPRREELAPIDGRYVGVDASHGFVLHDTRADGAWMRSDTTVDLDSVR